MQMQSRFDQATIIEVDALIIPHVTRLNQVTVGNDSLWPHIDGLHLADPTFFQPHRIDILIGAELYGTLLRNGLRQCAGLPTAQKTILGWILLGRLPAPASNIINDGAIQSNSYRCSVEDGLSKFWEIEETTTRRRNITVVEERCETFFNATVTRDNQGRLHVRLPLNDPTASFGKSLHNAVHRQLQIERKFVRHPEFETQYRAFMEQYEQLGHMRMVDNLDRTLSQPTKLNETTNREYYIPHHAVLKEASTSTKLRVVFDASRKSSNGKSLNDNLLIGPRLQDDLTAIIMRWRMHRIAYCADIEKMYRQIVVDSPDADMQRIVWRSSSQDIMKIYQLTTVTYGTASAPYLAVKALQTIANLEREPYPIGADIVNSSFYIDDVLSGADTPEACIEGQTQLIDLLASGGFVLRKWVSNSAKVLEQVPPDHRERQLPLNIDGEMCIKTLGIQWNPTTDELGFHIPSIEAIATETKRTFLSQAARLYDPHGWLAPSTIVVKLLFQQLWKADIDWDDELPANIAIQWTTLKKSMECLKELRIARWIDTTPDCKLEMHGFCDASMVAYAAVVFLRVTHGNGTVTTHNVISKTKVAPLKVISLPRLELCGAVLLSKLLMDVVTARRLSNVVVYCWTDSTIVLAWLRAEPSRFNIFVANRTSEIQRCYPVHHWHHVRSQENPSDCASRGLTPQQLIDHSLWWTGPQWLCETRDKWPKDIQLCEPIEEARSQAHVSMGVQTTYQWNLITKISNWRRLCRVTAWCRRFIINCRAQANQRTRGGLSVSEIIEAREFWVKDAQGAAFNVELKCLHGRKLIGKSSPLRSLNPTLSPNLVLLVGGRLANATTLPVGTKFPAIIPRRSPVAALLIADAHERTLHGGPSLMLALLRRSYWLIDGPREVRRHVHRCTTCFRFTASPTNQVMAALPTARVAPSRPFLHTALDYSGAIMVRSSKGRGQHATKAYVCVFVCLATKATHIELASDLSTQAFIAAYERFVSRRGGCTDLYSDNATTLTYEEMSTVLAKIEACLNSRPLHPMSCEPTEFDVLTPGHFLIGEPTLTIPTPNMLDIKTSALTRWKLTHQLVQRIWARWSVDYLHTLQQRNKWQDSVPNLQIGDMVLLLEDNMPPSKWAIGRIIETHPGSDGKVRVVTIRAKNSTYKRAVASMGRQGGRYVYA